MWLLEEGGLNPYQGGSTPLVWMGRLVIAPLHHADVMKLPEEETTGGCFEVTGRGRIGGRLHGGADEEEGHEEAENVDEGGAEEFGMDAAKRGVL